MGDNTIWYLCEMQWLNCRSCARGIGAGCGIFAMKFLRVKPLGAESLRFCVRTDEKSRDISSCLFDEKAVLG